MARSAKTSFRRNEQLYAFDDHLYDFLRYFLVATFENRSLLADHGRRHYFLSSSFLHRFDFLALAARLFRLQRQRHRRHHVHSYSQIADARNPNAENYLQRLRSFELAFNPAALLPPDSDSSRRMFGAFRSEVDDFQTSASRPRYLTTNAFTNLRPSSLAFQES